MRVCMCMCIHTYMLCILFIRYSHNGVRSQLEKQHGGGGRSGGGRDRDQLQPRSRLRRGYRLRRVARDLPVSAKQAYRGRPEGPLQQAENCRGSTGGRGREGLQDVGIRRVYRKYQESIGGRWWGRSRVFRM